MSFKPPFVINMEELLINSLTLAINYFVVVNDPHSTFITNFNSWKTHLKNLDVAKLQSYLMEFWKDSNYYTFSELQPITA